MTRAGRALARRGLEAFNIFAPEEDADLLVAGGVQFGGVGRRQAPGLVAAPNGRFADAQQVSSFFRGHKVGVLHETHYTRETLRNQ
jgi:hypothetical protein